jgi:cytochrome c oxidase subunit III
LSEVAHEHPYGLAHHFDSMEQQKEAATLGMWIFLATEIMFFGGAFLVYTVYRFAHYQAPTAGDTNIAFISASNHLDWQLGAINTVILICSSLTMALAVHAAQLGKRKGTVGFIGLTLVFGLAFLAIKTVEYSHKFHDRLVPGPNFDVTQFPANAQQAQIFFSLYFAITGIHAVHMIIGMVILIILAIHAWRGKYTAEYNSPIEMTGLYWHFVDIAWIFIFPLMYLFGRTHGGGH